MKIGEAVDKEQVILLSFGDCPMGGEYTEMFLYMVKKQYETLLKHNFLIAGRVTGGTVHHLVAVAEDIIVARSSFKRSVRNNFRADARAYV